MDFLYYSFFGARRKNCLQNAGKYCYTLNIGFLTELL